MKKAKIVLAVAILISVTLFALGIVFMVICDFAVAGLIAMWSGLVICIPIYPIYKKLGGYDIVFQDKLQTVLYAIGIILIIAFGVGVTLACYSLNLAIDGLQVGGILLAGFTVASMIVNAYIYDVIKKKD